jgi:hypothetical protein
MPWWKRLAWPWTIRRTCSASRRLTTTLRRCESQPAPPRRSCGALPWQSVLLTLWCGCSYTFAHALWPGDAIRPSLAHRFLVALAKQKKLLRVYSQNIDGLERAAGLPASLLVECHGSRSTARCRGCRKTCSAAALAAPVSRRVVPHCDACGGVWKPEVTFFGESLPKRVGKKLEADRSACARIIAQIVPQMIAALLWRSRQHISS